MGKTFPALDIQWAHVPSEDDVGRVVAALDEQQLTGAEQIDDGLRLFFRDSASRDGAIAAVNAVDRAARCGVVDVADERWAERSQASLGRVTVGALVIAPPWAVPGSGHPRVIIIRPSMGFGTGHHASTRLCLELLQRIDVTKLTVLDVGTGSGVLALAAWKLGARDVLAIDNDPDAIESARDNIALNGATNHVTVELLDIAGGESTAGLKTGGSIDVTGLKTGGSIDVAGLKTGGSIDVAASDVVLANLTGAALERHASRLARLVTGAGWLVAGGMQDDEAPRVERAFAGLGWRVVDRASDDGWTAATLRRR